MYQLVGIYISYVTINNGILFNGVKLRRKALVTASSVRFRLWGNTRKIIISDLKIELPDSPSGSVKNTAVSSSLPLQDLELSILPKNRIAKAALKLVLKVLPKFDIDVRSCDISKGQTHVLIASIQFIGRLERNHNLKNGYRLSANTTFIRFSIVLGNQQQLDPKISFGSLSLLTSCSLCADTGFLRDGTCRASIVDSQVAVFDLIKILGSNEPKDSPRVSEPIDQSRRNRHISKLHNLLFRTFEEVSITVANLKLKELPILPASQNYSLQDYLVQEQPNNSFQIAVKSMAIHLTKIRETTAGFEVLFNSSDEFPFKLTLSSLILEFTFVTINQENNCVDTKEFLTIPNFNCTFKTNIPGNLMNNTSLQSGALELFCSCSSPILDLDVEQLALLSFNYVAIKKILRLHKLSKHKRSIASDNSESLEASGSEDDDFTHVDSNNNSIGHAYKDTQGEPNSFERLLNGVYDILDECYPQVNIKLTIEQPRTLLSCYDTTDDKLQFLMLSYSMMILQVLSVSHQEYDTKCHVLHPCMSFNQKLKNSEELECMSQEFCGLSEIKLSCRVMKNFKCKPVLELHGAHLNLTRPKVLRGLNHLLNETAKLVALYSKHGQINKQLDGELVKERDHLYRAKLAGSYQKPFSIESVFTYIPAWLVSATIKLIDTDVWLGSASPFLQPQDFVSAFFPDDDTMSETEYKTHFHITSVKVQLEGPECESVDYTSSATTISLETINAEVDLHTFWKSTISVNEAMLAITNDNCAKTSLVLELPSITAMFKAVTEDSENFILVDVNSEELNILFDKQKAFALFGLVHLIKHTLVKPLQRLMRKLKKSSKALNLHLPQRLETPVHELIKSKLLIHSVNVVVGLFDNFKVRLQSFDLCLGQIGLAYSIQSLFLRVLISSSVQSGLWDRVLCVDTLSCKIGDPGDLEPCVIDTPSIRIIQPHKFVVYKLFDSLSDFIKVIKHLSRAISEKVHGTTIYSKESEPLNVPPIKLKSNKITFLMEDDPFESELTMIFQLGLVEQRKRLELLNLHEQNLTGIHDNENTIEERLQVLYKTMEALWIRKVKTYKHTVLAQIEKNKSYLFGKESEVSKEDNLRIRSYQRAPPLLHIILTGVDLSISLPRFAQKDLAQFIYDNGQGVPKSTTYNLLIPTFVRLAVEELRFHLRDYPLPMLYLPHMIDSTGKGRALLLHGNLIISEAMATQDYSLRRIEVQLAEFSRTSRRKTDEYGKVIIMKSLAPVKLYTDMDILFDSEQPSRFVWGQSYQFGIQQVMLKFDQFSKPPIDPSPKLGFWDKLRLIMHGHVTVKFGRRASLEVAFKGGRDPYNVFGDSTGFILRFKESVEWKINENDNSLEFFDVSARKVSWYIPNYLATPLVCWCRESSKYTFLPASKEIVTSSFGYYLLDEVTYSDENVREDACEKKVVVLSGGVNLKVGFLLQRESPENKISEVSIPHYEINQCDPSFAKKGHDSYEGFRSSRLHMAISLVAHTDESYNTIHLSPMTFRHFFAWWHLFAGNLMLPVRRGKLFGEEQKKTKFSENLYTNKFLFHLKNLFIGHVYRSEDLTVTTTKDEFECVGLRAKVDDFLVDLHQRKEQVIDVNEDLSRRNKIMKMLFNLGEVVLSKIDLRTLHAIFKQEVYSTGKQTLAKDRQGTSKIFDKDKRWYDYRDYLEAFTPSLTTVLKAAEIEPLLYSEKFSYIRDSSDGKDNLDWGHENTHECMLNTTDIYTTQIQEYSNRIEELKRIETNHRDKGSKKRLIQSIDCLNKLISECKLQRRKSVRRDSVATVETVKENFHNRFVLISMFLKWNEDVRNQFMKYLHFVQLNSRFKKYLSYGLISMLEDVIDGNDTIADTFSLATSLDPQARKRSFDNLIGSKDDCKDRLKNFESIVREVREKEKILEDFRVEIISPQIQLHTKEFDDSVVLITAPILESKIFSVVMEKEKDSNANVLETRYGCLLHDASVLVFEKNVSSDSLCFEEKPYGTTTNWPPFLGIETCKTLRDSLKNQTLIDRMSLMLTYDEIHALGMNIEQMEGVSESESQQYDQVKSFGNRLRIDVPELVIRSTSKQYFTLYVTVLSLLLYLEPLTVELREKVLKLKFSINFEDFNAVHDRLRGLHEYLAITKTLLNNYSFRHDGYLDNEALNDYLHLMDQKSELSAEILLTLQTLFTGDIFNKSESSDVENWQIAADKITLHMLEDDRNPILDLILERGVFKRLVNDDGSNDNCIEIQNIKGVTLLPDAYYETFLQLLSQSNDDLVKVSWSMSRPIGGIKVMDNFEIQSNPLNVRVDEETGRLLMKFIFYTEDGELNESPILKIADQTDLENFGNDVCDDEEDAGDLVSKNSSKEDLRRNDSISSKKTKIGSSKTPSISSPLNKSAEYNAEVELMLSRSKKYMSIVRMVSRSFEILISLHMKSGIKKWLNVTDFLLVLPEWEIERKVISLLDVANMFKKLVIKTLVQHSGRLLKNKFSSMLANRKRLSERLLHPDSKKAHTVKLVEVDNDTDSIIMEESE